MNRHTSAAALALAFVIGTAALVVKDYADGIIRLSAVTAQR